MDQACRLTLTALVLLGVGAHAASAQEPTVPGSAVLHISPVAADTLPILCRDTRPELGFITEMSDAEWVPRYDLSLRATNGDASELAIRIDIAGNAYEAAFPTTPSNEGILTVVAWIVRADGSGGRQISFAARCGERLVRGGAAVVGLSSPVRPGARWPAGRG